MPSLAFNRFYESYFGDPYMAWHDGLDESALLELEGDEREKAEQLLLDALNTNDYRPAAGLAALRSQRAAEPLKKELESARGRRRVEVAVALWRTERYMPAVAAIIDVLLSYPFWGDRVDAARALREVQTPRGEDALWKAIADPEDLVRHHAAESLLEMHGISAGDEIAHPVTIKVMSEDKKVREDAIKELEALLKGRE